jgi:hypothetical protein
MTWLELMTYIQNHPEIHNNVAYVYDFVDGSEYQVDIDEFKVNDGEWFPSITINSSELEN